MTGSERGERDLSATLSRLADNGVAGNGDLFRLYDLVSEAEKSRIVVALGAARGDLGVALLQGVLRDRNTPTDRRCAAVVAITKRVGQPASALLKACLTDHDEAVVRYAIRGLAVVGDDTAWAEMQKILGEVIVEQVPRVPFGMQWATLSLQSKVLPLACYLGRHLGEAGRRERVTALVRDHWSHLYDAEKRWFDEFWPQCNPDGPDEALFSPSPQALSKWVEHPLFEETEPVSS